MRRPFLQTLFLLGALTAAGYRADASEEARKRLVHADPAAVLSADPVFAKSDVDPKLILSIIPKGYVAVGFNSCAYEAADVLHDRTANNGYGVDYRRAGKPVAEFSWGEISVDGCSFSIGRVYDPKDPHDDWLKNLKEGDEIHEMSLALFAKEDIANYFSGNRKGHALCYPVNCPPLTIEFEGVGGINKVERRNDFGGGEVLWRK